MSILKKIILIVVFTTSLFSNDYEEAFFANKAMACESYFLGMCQGTGDPKAQNYLGEAYLKGYWVEKDLEEAVYWFKKASKQGNANAQYRLGTMYYSKDKDFFEKLAFMFLPRMSSAPRPQPWPHKLPADAISQDKDKALSLFEMSSNQGHPGGQYMLANMYSHGDIIQKDNKKAYNLYRKSANQNFSPAQVQLAKAYLHGIGTKTNFEKSVYWYEKALESKRYFYGGKYKVERIKAELVPMQKLADEGNAKAQYGMGQMYHGKTQRYFDITRNPEKAFFWYKKAIKNDYAPAQSAVGYMYCYGKERGQWVEQDIKKSLYWHHKAASQGYAKSYYNLNVVYSGRCVKNKKNSSFKIDKEKAKYWLKKANEAGYKN